jgi:hypothetical protein
MQTYISKVVRELYPGLVGQENAIMKYYEEDKSIINEKIKKLGVNVEYLNVTVKSRGGSSQKGGDIYIYLVASLVICGLFYKLKTIKDQVEKLQNTTSNARDASFNARDASLRSLGATRSLLESLAENQENREEEMKRRGREESGTSGIVVTKGWRKRNKTPTRRSNTRPSGKKLGTLKMGVPRQRKRSKSPGTAAFLALRNQRKQEKEKYNSAMKRINYAVDAGRPPMPKDLKIVRWKKLGRMGGKKTKKRKNNNKGRKNNNNKRRKNTRRRKRAGHHAGWDF